MKLTKKLEAEILEVNKAYWESYINGSWKKSASFLDDNIKMIGSTEDEVYYNKKEATKFFKNTAKEVKGSIEMRSRKIEVIPVAPYIMLNEETDLYIKTSEAWVFYSKVRLTSLMRKTVKGWKFIQQHGSVPDAKVNDGESIGFNQISKENLELRDAIKRRTAELELKNRELEIETALEKVRAIAMGMKHQADMLEVCKTIAEQLKQLGVNEIRNVQTAIINEAKGTYLNYEFYAKHKKIFTTEVNFKNNKIQEKFAVQMLAGAEELLTQNLKGKKLKDWYAYQQTTNQFVDKYLEQAESLNYYWYSLGPVALGISSYASLTDEEINLFKRFRNVFELAYRRFVDIEKAEAQAREATIEAALERVRSRTMGMNTSAEMKDLVSIVIKQLIGLGFKIDLANFNYLRFSKEWLLWMATPDFTYPELLRIPVINHPLFNRPIEAYKQGQDFMSDILTAEEFKSAYTHFYESSEIDQWDSPERKRYVAAGIGMARSVVLMKNITLTISNFQAIPYSDEQNQILKRFTNAFEQAYIRFLDLQKAEAQTREAKIETALEKVRSHSLAMHKSNELQEVVKVVFEKLKELGLSFDGGAGIQLFTENSKDSVLWVVAPDQISSSSCINLPYSAVDFIDNPIITDVWKAKETGEAIYNKTYNKEEKNKYFNYVFKHNNLIQIPQNVRNEILQTSGYTQAFVVEKNSCIIANSWSGQTFSTDDFDIFKRIARVFEQAYTRFLDLQKAETQAREATIEAALEKVRGKAMAMHNSNDLLETAGMVFTELRKLGIKPMRAGVGLQNKENRQILLYSATSSNEVDSLSMVGTALLDEHPVLTNIHDTWLRGEDYFFVMSGDILKTYYEKVTNNFNVPNQAKAGLEHHGYFLSFSEGTFYGYYEQPISEDKIKTLRRFNAIIDLTFRRYLELQKSESIAKDAIRQATLDRVRAEIASMRTKEDLDRIIPLVWRELTTMGIPFVRCGVFIIDDVQEQIHTFLSTPDGKAIAAFHLPYGTGNLTETVNYWRAKKMYLTHWGAQEFSVLADVLVEQKSIATREQYLNTLPKDGIHLHYLPFLQGMLYVGNTNVLNDDDLQLVQSLADAFSTAYARYEDFNKLEAAKQQVDKTLLDLKQAQQQLVQSEKMASLGELTAGIAHEIQNPLNFVNNFSEVNTEMLEELKAERLKPKSERNDQLAEDIINDVLSNEEKINHHGKRADAIVKGMLQHNQASTGKKEATDINKLADEYLRLSYHGLRGKDKLFNATTKTDFDDSIGRINIIPRILEECC